MSTDARLGVGGRGGGGDKTVVFAFLDGMLAECGVDGVWSAVEKGCRLVVDRRQSGGNEVVGQR